jgi:hypothetical protein
LAHRQVSFALVAAARAVLVVHYYTIFYFLPLFTLIHLDLPSLVKVPAGGLEGFFGRPARAASAGWSRLRHPPSPAAMADEMPAGKLTVPTSLILRELIIGSNFCQDQA